MSLRSQLLLLRVCIQISARLRRGAMGNGGGASGAHPVGARHLVFVSLFGMMRSKTSSPGFVFKEAVQAMFSELLSDPRGAVKSIPAHARRLSVFLLFEDRRKSSRFGQQRRQRVTKRAAKQRPSGPKPQRGTWGASGVPAQLTWLRIAVPCCADEKGVVSLSAT